VSELWEPEEKTSSKKNYSIDGYHDFEFVGGKTKNSGCGIFVKDNLKYKVRDELNSAYCSNSEEFQIHFIELLFKSGNILIFTLYRHPKATSFTEFQNSLDTIFRKIKK